MAVGLIVAVANGLLDTLRTTYQWVKLHIGDPGAAAASNPAVNTTRVQGTFASAAASGTYSNTAAIQWTSVPASEDYTHFSTHTAVSAGSPGFTGVVTASPVTAGDTFTVPIGDMDVTFAVAS